MTKEQEEKTTDYYFEYSFTQTISGFAAAPSSEDLSLVMYDNWGDLPNFRILNITEATEEQSKEIRNQMNKERTLN